MNRQYRHLRQRLRYLPLNSLLHSLHRIAHQARQEISGWLTTVAEITNVELGPVSETFHEASGSSYESK